jgi:hypothetical protein
MLVTVCGGARFQAMDDAHARACAAQSEMLRHIAAADARETWAEFGARDMAHFLFIRYGISDWKARRWIAAAHALVSLPRLMAAFEKGDLRIDKVVELARYATPETEAALVEWARDVPSARIREEADRAARRERDDASRIELDRRVAWWYHDEGRRFAMSADLPAADGAIVARAIDRLAETLPGHDGNEVPDPLEGRRADALVAFASERLGADADPDRATVVVHVRVDAAARGHGSAIEGGGIVDNPTVERLLCHARVQGVLEDGGGNPVRMGRVSRNPSAAMLRLLRHRDVGCVFPGCGTRVHVKAHHVAWWSAGGRTDPDNLVLLCRFHHVQVHEMGWSLTRRVTGALRWYRPDGRRFRAGPAPPPRERPAQPPRATPTA